MAHLARELRSHLLWFMTHELDEMLMVDGQRANDPHSIQHVQVSGRIVT